MTADSRREQCESCGTTSEVIITLYMGGDVEPFRVCQRCARIAQPLRLPFEVTS